MENYILPATRYEPPARQARSHPLNTIIERSEVEHHTYNDTGRIHDRGRGRSLLYTHSTGSARSVSPVPSLTSSMSSCFPDNRVLQEFDELYDVSDEESCDILNMIPGRTTDVTGAHFGNPEKSLDSKTTRNRYPSIVTPSSSHWPIIQKLPKTSPSISPARPPEIPLSPAVLSMLNRHLPSSSQTPSLDESLNSDLHASSTGPTTPDTHSPVESAELGGAQEIKENLFRGAFGSLFKVVKAPEANVVNDETELWEEDTSGFDTGQGTIVRDFGSERGYSLQDSPVLGLDEDSLDAGVQLPPEALDTLQHLTLETPVSAYLASDTGSIGEMEEIPCAPLPRTTIDMTPVSQRSDYSLDQLSIPSPGGFFSSLGSNYRSTWCPDKSRPMSSMPPTSTVAERFYNFPWDMDPQATVSHVICVDTDVDSNGPPTARQVHYSSETVRSPTEGISALPPQGRPSSATEYDLAYEQEIKHNAEDSLDRTSCWLAAQSSYMSALRERNPVNDLALDTTKASRRPSLHSRNDSLESPMKKAVRFLETENEQRQDSEAEGTEHGDSIYYHAFQHIQHDKHSQDAFRHGQTRSDSVQAERICLPHEHLDRLQGAYKISKVDRPTPLRPISMFPGKEKDESEQTTEQKAINRVEKERQALHQLNTSMWVIEASRFLNQGKLLNSPAAKALVSKSRDQGSSKNMRILDLGGLPNCDWAWHCAREYPSATVHTATTRSFPIDFNIRGPANHRSVEVLKLWSLPYADNSFDVISARSLFTHLKNEKPLGQAFDEYDLCLQECRRCLKSGGYLEFFLLDSEILSPGPRGTAASVEFSFSLKTRGYDPVPTKNWLGRVRRAGFDDIKRAWTFLPMGTSYREIPPLPETPPPDDSTFDPMSVEAVHGPVGSTADAASMTGLVGSWAWEQWMLKLQTEMGKEQLLEGVGSVFEEGKSTGAGWRSLSGWARKPLGS